MRLWVGRNSSPVLGILLRKLSFVVGVIGVVVALGQGSWLFVLFLLVCFVSLYDLWESLREGLEEVDF